MLPTPIISTETLASCAEATQTEAPKTIGANRDRFIIHQIILAPLARTPKIGCRVSPAIGLSAGMPLPNDARNVRGTIERSINVDSLQHHHELGCSVTNECGVSLLPLPFAGAMDAPGSHSARLDWRASIDVRYCSTKFRSACDVPTGTPQACADMNEAAKAASGRPVRGAVPSDAGPLCNTKN